MNIFNKVALQGLKKSRTRTFVTIIGVALSAALITAIATFGVSLLNYMIKGAAQKNGDWHIAFLDVPSSFVQERIQDKEVADTVTFDNIGYAALNGSKNPDKPYLFIVGFGEETFQTLPVKLLSGRMPENSGEILVSASVAANGGVKFSVGDTLSLDVGSRMNGSKTLTQHDPYSYENEALAAQEKRTYTVVGICQRPVFEERTAPGYTLITKADEQSRTNNYTLFVKLEKPHTARVYANSTAENYAYIFNDDVLRFMGISNDNVFNTFLYSVAGIVIIIIMIGSVFLIHNAFHISLNERTHQFGILMSVGATEKQLRNSVLFEGLCVGAAGIPIGVITGIFGIKIVLSVVARNFGNIMYDTVPLTLVVSVPAIVGASVISLLTILISAYIPARKAVGIPVMECIRQTNEVKTESKTVKTSKFTEKIYGLEGTLALKNFKRNKRRYRSIVLSLILSVVLFIATSAFVADLKQAAGQTASVTTYDIGFATQDMEEHEMLALYDKLKTADSVYDSSYQALMTYSCTAKAGDFSEAFLNQTDSHLPDETVDLTMQIQFIDDNAYQNLLKDLGLSAEEYTGQNAKLFACAKIEDNSSQVKKSGEFVNMFTNSSMNFAIVPKTEEESEIGDEKNVTITFADFVPPDTLPVLEITESTPYIFMVMAPYSLKDTFVSPDTRVDVKGLTFQSKNPTRSAEEMEAMILSEGITADYTLYNTREMLEENSNMIFIANVFSYTFIVMISLIAVANVFNTISTNIKLRKRELAMLRSVGMSERDFQKMMNFECIFYGMRALFVGLPIGILSSWLIYKGMYSGGADAIDFVMPWVSIGISIVGVLFIVFITMLYSTNKIKKENIIDALRDDMA